MTKTYAINTSKALSETLDGETIIINLESGNYYSMNPIGTLLWNTIMANSPINTSPQPIADFLAFLCAEDLITEVPESGSGSVFTTHETPKIDKYDDMQEMLLADPVHDVDEAGWPKLKEHN